MGDYREVEGVGGAVHEQRIADVGCWPKVMGLGSPGAEGHACTRKVGGQLWNLDLTIRAMGVFADIGMEK